jgi:3-oxoadipate enol-lactonase
MAEPLVLGRNEAGSGRVLLLVHGFPLDSEMWAEQMQPLAHGRRVIAVDLRGRGKSLPAGDAPWSLDTHADDLARTLEELREDRIDFAGLSMGGYIAFAFMRRYGQRVRSLILINTKASADTSEAKQARSDNAELVQAEGSRALVPVMAPKLVAPHASHGVQARVQAMIERTPAETCARDLLAMRDRPDATPLLSSLSVPVLVVHGEDDQLVPVSAAEEMAAAIPRGSFVGIAGASHLAPLENPTAVNAAISAFLAKLDRRR